MAYAENYEREMEQIGEEWNAEPWIVDLADLDNEDNPLWDNDVVVEEDINDDEGNEGNGEDENENENESIEEQLERFHLQEDRSEFRNIQRRRRVPIARLTNLYLDKFALTRLISERAGDLQRGQRTILTKEELDHVVKRYQGKTPQIELDIAIEEFRKVLMNKGKELDDYQVVIRYPLSPPLKVKVSEFTSFDPQPLYHA